MSSNRAAVSACMRRLTGVAPWGARSSSLPGYLRLSASSRRLLLVFISVWLGLAARLPALSSVSLPLLRSGRGLGRCRLLPLPGIGLAAPSLCGVCAAAPPWAAAPGRASSSGGASWRLRRAVTLSTVSVTLLFLCCDQSRLMCCVYLHTPLPLPAPLEWRWGSHWLPATPAGRSPWCRGPPSPCHFSHLGSNQAASKWLTYLHRLPRHHLLQAPRHRQAQPRGLTRARAPRRHLRR